MIVEKPPPEIHSLPGVLTVAQAMEQANAAYGGRQWAQAEYFCRSILRAHAEHFAALNLLGVITAQTGRQEEAAELLARAVAAQPRDASAHNNHGNVLRGLGRCVEALDCFERALALAPDYADAYNNRGIVLQELKQLAEARQSYERAIEIRPDHAEAHCNRGAALHELERHDEALQSYERALKIRPNYAEAHRKRGMTLHELKRFDEAHDSFQRALALNPDLVQNLNNRGVALQRMKRFAEAAASYEEALQLNPDLAEAHSNRGLALHALNRFAEALESCDRALKLRPDLAEAYNHRGNTLQQLKRHQEALQSYECALKIKPGLAEAYCNQGLALQSLQQHDAALESYDRALTLNPDLTEALHNRGDVLVELKRLDAALDSYARALELRQDHEWLYGNWLHTKMKLCDWRELDSQVAHLVDQIRQGTKATAPFPVLALVDSLSQQRQAAENWAREAHASTSPAAFARRGRLEKIRVAYFSADFHNHATAYLMAELFEKHDRTRFEWVAFSFGPDFRDDMRTRLSAAFDRFVDVSAQSDREVAALSRELEIDIAVDLKGFTQDERHRIFSHRAAPVQVNYLGCPGTVGVPYLDYIVADPILIPEDSRRHYAEKVVYLPNSYQANDRRRKIAEREFSRAELGLPPAGFVFCCFNSAFKITPGTFDGWMRILNQVEGSVLWLLEDNRTASNNLRREAETRGVDAARLVFAPRLQAPEHLARHRAANLFLDTLPCNAHTTASDALWAGLPVLTCMGESFAARVGASLLSAIGLPELIATTQEQYETLAVELARNPRRLAEIAERLRTNRLTTPLFDTELLARHLEDAYSQMYERYQAELSPGEIYAR